MKVSLEKLSLAYGDFVAVRSLDLVIPDGESVVLLGQSGCGKTTTMRCIAGLEQPTEGTIRIGDRDVFNADANKNVPSFKRNVGMVFQSYAVWPHKTVLQNVSFPLTVKKLSKSAARAKSMEVLEMVGLAHLADRGASALSGGQMQRVALARSLAMEPSVMLLDEPLSNLDARLRDDLRVELRRLQQENGLTSLYVTHDQHEALALADQIAIMQEGRITQLAAPADLYSRPNSASIASFLGMSNVFPISTESRRGRLKLADHEFEVSTEENLPAQDASVCFRPEAVEVNDPTSMESIEPNTWNGTVRVAVFQGHTVRYQIQIHNGPDIDAICEAAAAPFKPIGSQVRVHVPVSQVLVLPNEVLPAAEERSAA